MTSKQIISFVSLLLTIVNADLRMASTPKNNFVIQNGQAGTVPFTKNSIVAVYMEPSDFNYQGLKNQRANNYDNFLRSNVDNEQDNRDFNNEIGRDMLPFRTLEANSANVNVINAVMGKKTLIPLRWNNPHSSECEINIWIKNGTVVVPIRKPSCCGEGYQDNIIDFTIPSDFNQLARKVPGFTGCNKIGDCTLQIYAHSVEPRSYAIGTPIIIANSTLAPGTYTPATDNTQIKAPTVDPQLNLNSLPNDVCLPTTHVTSTTISAVPRFARLVSDQFNHAYQNSDFSPYSGQQHELISRNLQAATILRMTAANGGELGKSILTSENKKFIETLINNVNKVVQKYEKAANNIFNSIKNQYAASAIIGDQQLANCFRCTDTGSVNPDRIEQQTYIPSFEIKDLDQANQIRNSLQQNVKNLLPVNSPNVQIYTAALKEMTNDFVNAAARGFVYQPAVLKNTVGTMKDITNFLKVDASGNQDDGVYAATAASSIKLQNINKITNLALPTTITQPTTVPLVVTTNNIQPTTPFNTIPTQDNTLLPNPDDQSTVSGLNFCGQTYETVDCNKPCPYGLDIECATGICFNVLPNVCQPITVTTTNIPNISAYCGVSYETIDCTTPCPSGLDMECVTGTCFYTLNCAVPTNLVPVATTSSIPLVDSTTQISSIKTEQVVVENNSYFCGIDTNNFNCSMPCTSGLSSECSNDNTILCLNVAKSCSDQTISQPLVNQSFRNKAIRSLIFSLIILCFI